MNNQRILDKLDIYLNANDYAGAERHLMYWLLDAKQSNNTQLELLMNNELIGLHRKLGNKEKALEFVRDALNLVSQMNIVNNLGAATTYINCGTAYKAFGDAEASLALFDKAKEIYHQYLPADDVRWGGLYNNMALALVDVRQFAAASFYYNRAIGIMEITNKPLEVAITYLNLADAKVAELGLEESEATVSEYLNMAMQLLDSYEHRDGYYAFVCDKCASVFGYYGYFAYQSELERRRNEIYART